MGIKSLTKLIRQNTENSIETKKLYQLSGKKVAIDTSILIYQYLMNIRSNNKLLTNKKGEVTSHISGIFYKTINYLSLGIEPIYVFDGKPPADKYNLIKDRNKKAENAKSKLKNASSEEDILKYEKMSTRINKSHIDDIKKLLNFMGIEYIQDENGEAEGIASELCRIGYVDYVVTEDMDALVYNCPRMIRNNLDKTVKTKDIISVINLEEILKSLELSQDKFIELCILCGCDYCENIPRVGHVKALKIIKEYDNIESFLESNKTYKIPEDYLKRYKKSIEIFNMYKDKYNTKIPSFKSNLDISKLINYLVSYCDLSELKVQNAIQKMQNSFYSKTSLPDGLSKSPHHLGNQ